MEAPARVAQQTSHQCRADLGQGPGHTLKNVHKTNHQSPITNQPTNQPTNKEFHDMFHDMFVH